MKKNQFFTDLSKKRSLGGILNHVVTAVVVDVNRAESGIPAITPTADRYLNETNSDKKLITDNAASTAASFAKLEADLQTIVTTSNQRCPNSAIMTAAIAQFREQTLAQARTANQNIQAQKTTLEQSKIDADAQRAIIRHAPQVHLNNSAAAKKAADEALAKMKTDREAVFPLATASRTHLNTYTPLATRARTELTALETTMNTEIRVAEAAANAAAAAQAQIQAANNAAAAAQAKAIADKAVADAQNAAMLKRLADLQELLLAQAAAVNAANAANGNAAQPPAKDATDKPTSKTTDSTNSAVTILGGPGGPGGPAAMLIAHNAANNAANANAANANAANAPNANAAQPNAAADPALNTDDHDDCDTDTSNTAAAISTDSGSSADNKGPAPKAKK